MKIFHTDKAPAAVGPYSQAVAAGGMLYLSGQIAIDPVAGKIVATDIAGQAEQNQERDHPAGDDAVGDRQAENGDLEKLGGGRFDAA